MRIILLSALVLFLSCEQQEKSTDVKLLESSNVVHLHISKEAFISADKNSMDAKESGESYRLKFNRKKQWYKLKVNQKKALFGQRKWQVFFVNDSADLKKFQAWEKQENRFRLAGLMSFSTHWARLVFNDGKSQQVFLRAYPSSYFLELNKKKEGELFSFKKDGKVKLLNSIKEDVELEEQFLQSAKKLLVEQKVDLAYFDSSQVKKIFHELKLPCKSEGIIFYHNPMSGKLELLYRPPIGGQNFIPEFSFYSTSLVQHYEKYFRTDIQRKELTLRTRQTLIHSLIELPEGYCLKLNKGDIIVFKPSAGIIVLGSVIAKGTCKEPIVIQGEKGNYGFHVLGSSDTSQLSNVHFEGVESRRSVNRNLSGAVTFYKTSVVLDSCFFMNNKSEDALHLFSTDFTIHHLEFKNCISDALDIDFSKGSIIAFKADTIYNDAIDLSGSEVHIENCFFNAVKDKAMSFGEKSVVNGQDIAVQNSTLAIAVKDSSVVKLSKLQLDNNVLLYAVYRKKREYGPATLIVKKAFSANNEEEHLIEKGSQLTVNGSHREGKMNNVRKYFKAEEYGR